MRVIFMGSPQEVISPLASLLALSKNSAEETSLVGVVSHPPKPVGRRKLLQPSPVAEFASQNHIPLMVPEKANDAKFLAEIRALAPDVIVTAAYGQILTDEFLKIPKRATINIHPSLLPAYRGASPVQQALLDGRETSGVTLLFTVKKLDAGNIICQESTAIARDETYDVLLKRLFAESTSLLTKALDYLKDHGFQGFAQDESQVTHTRKFTKESGRVNWNQAAVQILNQYRAFTPWPGLFGFLGDKRVRLLKVKESSFVANETSAPGTFWFDKGRRAVVVETGNGFLDIHELQAAGSKPLGAGAFWNGLSLKDKGKFNAE